MTKAKTRENFGLCVLRVVAKGTWPSWFCLDGGDEPAFLRSLDVSSNLIQDVKEVAEDIVLFQNQFLTCIVIFTGDREGMQSMGGAGSKCWFCGDPDGIVEQMGVESTSRWGVFMRCVTPDGRLGGLPTCSMPHSKWHCKAH